MTDRLVTEEFIQKHPNVKSELEKNNISWDKLNDIYLDYKKVKEIYETQADFIANTLRTHSKIHTVKSRTKSPERLIEKIIRKTSGRKEKYGEGFEFDIHNYKEEINDLIGIRAIHIFKEEWESIHEFILSTWKVIEITANVREGDKKSRFEELGIEIKSRKSGYRSVHYLIEFYPTSEKVIAEIQVRTIFEEGYGEIDHKLRYSLQEIPEIIESNLLLFNRIIGSADEMASFINNLKDDMNFLEEKYKNTLLKKDEEIKKLKEKIEKNRI